MGKEITYEDIIRSIRSKVFAPVYFLMGEEDYYIDRIADYIADTVLTDSEKEFNLTVIYGADTDVNSVINAARRYPMMSEYQVVIVKEAQILKAIDTLTIYLQNPMPSTILVVCYKHGSIDRRKKLAAEIEKVGVLFESKKLKDTQIPGFISTYLKRKKMDIDPAAAEMMADFVGTDLNRMAGELEKLIISVPADTRRISPDIIERNIGISKDFNNLELRNALIEKDILKANRIVKYFEDNPKQNPLAVTLAVLFNFYANLMIAYYSPDRSEQGVAQQLGLRSAWQARSYLSAMQHYSGVKVMHILEAIRMCDVRSKGVDNASVSDGQLLRTLIYTILH